MARATGCEVKKRIVLAVVIAVLLTASTYAQTPGFFKLVLTGTPQRVQAAIDQGADVNTRSPNGVTALILPQSTPNPKVITTFLKAGVDAKAKDKAGLTAFDYVQGNEKLNGTDDHQKLNEWQY